jgi:hypothetical protein
MTSPIRIGVYAPSESTNYKGQHDYNRNELNRIADIVKTVRGPERQVLDKKIIEIKGLNNVAENIKNEETKQELISLARQETRALANYIKKNAPEHREELEKAGEPEVEAKEGTKEVEGKEEERGPQSYPHPFYPYPYPMQAEEAKKKKTTLEKAGEWAQLIGGLGLGGASLLIQNNHYENQKKLLEANQKRIDEENERIKNMPESERDEAQKEIDKMVSKQNSLKDSILMRESVEHGLRELKEAKERRRKEKDIDLSMGSLAQIFAPTTKRRANNELHTLDALINQQTNHLKDF